MRLRNESRGIFVGAMFLAIGLFLSGCSDSAPTLDDAKKAANDAADNAKDAMGDMKDAADKAGDAAKDAAESAGDALSSAADEAKEALANVEGGSEILTSLQDLLGSTTETLKGVTDEASAEAAATKLGALETTAGGLSEKLGALPEGAKTAISGMLSKGLAGLKPLVDKVLAIPGVSAVLKPKLDSLMAKLKGLVGG